jgi:hypothetical protein
VAGKAPLHAPECHHPQAASGASALRHIPQPVSLQGIPKLHTSSWNLEQR